MHLLVALMLGGCARLLCRPHSRVCQVRFATCQEHVAVKFNHVYNSMQLVSAASSADHHHHDASNAVNVESPKLAVTTVSPFLVS